MTTRRSFIKLLGGAAAAWPLAARAQHPTSIRIIGFLGTDPESNSVPWVDGLRAGLREFGYVEGKEIRFEFRYAERKYHYSHRKCEQRRPSCIRSRCQPLAARREHDWSCFLQPRALREAVRASKGGFPQIGTVAVLLNPNNPISGLNLQATEYAAKALHIELKQFGARDPRDLESAFIAIANSRVDALAVLEDPMLIANAGAIGQLALKQHLPSIGFKEIAEGGGLMAYGVNFPDMFRQSARLIDKIFKGSKPSDLPVERVTRFEFVANLKTARVIGVTLPTSILLRADEVIE